MPHVTMIHGIRNKPEPDELLERWNRALAKAGLDLAGHGVTTSMVYWADVMHAQPRLTEEPDAEAIPDREDAELAERHFAEVDPAFAHAMTEAIGASTESLEEGLPDHEPPPGEELIPVPLSRFLMEAFVWEVFKYLTNKEHEPRPGETYRVQDEVRSRFIEALRRDQAGNTGPHVVLAHSMGTVISYDCLKRVADCPHVDALITLGCPLGLEPVQDELKPEWTKEDGFPSNKLAIGWTNIADPLDLVSIDTSLASEYREGGEKRITDEEVSNPGGRLPGWDHHSIREYLAREPTRRALSEYLALS